MKIGRRILAGVIALCMAAGLAISPVSMGEVNNISYSMAAVKAAAAESGQKATAGGIDILDYESNASAVEFVVNDIAGFEKIAELVNSGKEYFSGKTITLNADLKYDKTVENNHNVIGDYDHAFDGIFDGAFHTISGINLNSDLRCVGLFGRTGSNAKLSRIILENSSIISQGSPSSSLYFVGGIASGPCDASIEMCISGKNVEVTGEHNADAGGIAGDMYADISRCINFSTVSGANNVGGITGSFPYKGEIENCINYGMVYSKSSDFTCVGGISGESHGRIVECCNMGTILYEVEIKGTTSSGVGGIIGGSETVVVNCYNGGRIIGADGLHAGGIIGTSMDSPRSIQNSYSVGEVKNGYAGAITSVFRSCLWELSNCYWLTGTALYGVCETGRGDEANPPQNTSSVFEYSRSQMTSQDFINDLNVNSKNMGYDEVWVADTENINNGYPVLKNVPYKAEDLKGSGDSYFEYKVMDEGTIEITKYIGSGTVVEVPEMIDGRRVTSIGKEAFKLCQDLTKVTIPEGVASIGADAFWRCTSLAEISIPSSVTSIGRAAFYDCANVGYFTIPEGITHIEAHTFDGCTRLKEITVPDSVTSIGDAAFQMCAGLTKVSMSDKVTSIGEFLFNGCKSLTEIIIPDSVTSIERNAFFTCTSLTEIIIPNSVASIGSHAFNGCTGLTKISISDSVTSIQNYAFLNCSNLKDVYYSGTKEQWDKIEISSGNEELLNAEIHFKDDGPQPPQEETTLPAITNPKQELERLKSSGSLSLAQDFRHYMSKEQLDIVESCIYTWLADINYAYKYSGSSAIKELIMKKAGIDPQGSFEMGTEQAVTHISIKTNYGIKTFEITLDLGKPDSSGNLYPSYGAMHYEVLEKGHIPSDVPKSGQIGRASYAELGAFVESVSRAADESLQSTYQKHPLSSKMAAGVLIDKTAAEIIGNKNGAFSRGTFIVYAEPLFTYSKKVKAAGPADVYVYTMDGKEAGSSVGKKPDNTARSVRLKEADSGADSANPNVRFDVGESSTTVYLAGDDYYLNLRGTGTGTMTYEVEEIANEEVQRNVQFLELQLEKDMQYEGYVFRPLNIDKDLYTLRTVDSSGQEVFCEGKDSQYQTLSLFKQVEGLTLSRGNTSLDASLDASKTVQLSADWTPFDASNPNLQWSTDNASVAQVDGSGLVTAVGAGRATVTVSTKDGSFLKQFCVIDVADKNSGNSTGGNSGSSGSSGSTSGNSGGSTGSNSSSGSSSGSSGSSSGSSTGSSGSSSGNSSDSSGGFRPSLEQEPAPAVVSLYYVLQFNLNGGTELSRRTMTLLADDIPGIMPKAKRKNYTFKGWYTQQEGGVKITGDKPLKEAATLYAQWTKTKAPAKSAAPSLKSKKKGQLQVSIKKVSGAAGYQIEYSANKKFTSAKKKSTAALAKTITGLKAGKKYYIRMRAYSVDSMNNRIYGAYSAVKSVKIKG